MGAKDVSCQDFKTNICNTSACKDLCKAKMYKAYTCFPISRGMVQCCCCDDPAICH